MSKLSSAIEAKQTGRVKVFDEPTLYTVSDSLSGPVRDATYNAKREYRIGVTLNVMGYVDDHHAKDLGFQLVRLKDMCKRQLVQNVFGEFLPLIRTVERHIYMHDFEAALTALRHLENEMLS